MTALRHGEKVNVTDALGRSWEAVVESDPSDYRTLIYLTSRPEEPIEGVPAVARAWLEKRLRDFLGEPPVPKARLDQIRSHVAAKSLILHANVWKQQRADLYLMLIYYECLLDTFLCDNLDWGAGYRAGQQQERLRHSSERYQ